MMAKMMGWEEAKMKIKVITSCSYTDVQADLLWKEAVLCSASSRLSTNVVHRSAAWILVPAHRGGAAEVGASDHGQEEDGTNLVIILVSTIVS